jgi:ribonucleoside-diphosphate reductase alpha chain
MSERHSEYYDQEIANIFVVAHDIAPSDRINLQAAAQKYITMAISSTVNLPKESTIEDIEKIYKLAHSKQLKGITVYRDGCLEDQPVNFGKKVKIENKEERPDILNGFTRKIKTGSGHLYLTINELDNKPFEVFATIGKSGRTVSAKAEAIGRLVSLLLRSGASVNEIVKQLEGIGGDYPIFQKGGLIKSIPDAIALVLKDKYLVQKIDTYIQGDICVQCGKPTLVKMSGCKSGICTECGYSSCS